MRCSWVTPADSHRPHLGVGERCDPSAEPEAGTVSHRLEALACIGLVVAWASCLIFVPLGIPLLTTAIVWFLLRRAPVKAAAFFMASPFALLPLCACLTATLEFATGGGEILTWGTPSYNPGTLDGETSRPRRSTGCVLTGTELLYDLPNNVTLRMLHRIFESDRLRKSGRSG